jgi:hypothetical protein
MFSCRSLISKFISIYNVYLQEIDSSSGAKHAVEMNMIITNIYHQLLSIFVYTELKSNTVSPMSCQTW